MGSVIQLKKEINNSYLDLKNSVEDKLALVDERIISKLSSNVDLVHKMTEYHLSTGGKRLRALLTLGSAKLSGYNKGGRDINLAACVEFIHTATLLHDDVVDEASTRRGVDTVHSRFNTRVAVLAGDFLFAQASWHLANLDDLEVVKLLSRVIMDLADGEVTSLLIETLCQVH